MARLEELETVSGKPSAKAKAVAAAAERVSHLDDPAVQDAIQNPKPFSVTIAGAERPLFALSARKNRELDGFFRIVLADTIGGDASAIRSLRMVGILLERYSDRAISFIAAATEPVGVLTDAGIAMRANEIGDVISAQEIADGFIALCERERVLERFSKAGEAAVAAPK